jgi:hypothetical protein
VTHRGQRGGAGAVAALGAGTERVRRVRPLVPLPAPAPTRAGVQFVTAWRLDVGQPRAAMVP